MDTMHTNWGSHIQLFGQDFPETLALGNFVAYAIGLGGDFTSVPSSTPGFVVETMKYVFDTYKNWGIDDPAEIDYWIRQRLGSVKLL